MITNLYVFCKLFVYMCVYGRKERDKILYIPKNSKIMLTCYMIVTAYTIYAQLWNIVIFLIFGFYQLCTENQKICHVGNFLSKWVLFIVMASVCMSNTLKCK